MPMWTVPPVWLLILVRALFVVPMQALTLLPYSRLIGVPRTVPTSLAGASRVVLDRTFSVVSVLGESGTDPVSCG